MTVSNGIDTVSFPANLDANQTLKTDNAGAIISSDLAIADTNGLQTALDAKLSKASNLSDLTDASIARSSLGLGSVLVDISTIQGINTAQATSITAIELKNTQQDTSIGNINTSVTAIELKNTQQDTSIGNINTSVTAIELKNTQQDTSIGNINTSVTAIELKNTQQDTSITNINTALNTKVDKIVSTANSIPKFTSIDGSLSNSAITIDSNNLLNIASKTTTQINALTGMVTGAQVYNSDLKSVVTYDSVSWNAPIEGKIQTQVYQTNTTNMKVAIGVRKIVKQYTGKCLNLRRVSDNELLDIGFDANGYCSFSEYTTFIGAGTGRITRFYDQTGNGNDYTSDPAGPTNIALMAQLSFQTINGVAGVPVVDWNQSLNAYACIRTFTLLGLDTTNFVFSTAFYLDTITTTSHIFGSAGPDLYETRFNSSTSITVGQQPGQADNFTVPAALNNGYHTLSTIYDRTNAQVNVRFDGVLNTPAAASIPGANGLSPSWGAEVGENSQRFDGRMSELIIWNAIPPATLLTTIENDQKAVWINGSMVQSEYDVVYESLAVSNNLKLVSTEESYNATTGSLVVKSAGIESNLNVGGSLSLTSTTTGLKINSLTTAQRDTLIPTTGLLIFNNTVGVFQFYLSSGTPGWRTLTFSN